jgi:hypothetical protein
MRASESNWHFEYPKSVSRIIASAWLVLVYIAEPQYFEAPSLLRLRKFSEIGKRLASTTAFLRLLSALISSKLRSTPSLTDLPVTDLELCFHMENAAIIPTFLLSAPSSSVADLPETEDNCSNAPASPRQHHPARTGISSTLRDCMT